MNFNFYINGIIQFVWGLHIIRKNNHEEFRSICPKETDLYAPGLLIKPRLISSLYILSLFKVEFTFSNAAVIPQSASSSSPTLKYA